jgi:lipocalin
MLKILLLFSLLFKVYSNEYGAVKNLDLDNYIGTWYQIYEDNFDKTFQGNGKCAKAYYKMNENNISVLNTQLDIEDNLENITGYAYYKDGNTGGYLTVKLEDNPEAPYWVIELGPIVSGLYDYSIVSDNLRLSLFVLARNVSQFYQIYEDEVLLSLKKFGFTNIINKPIKMDQQNC